MAEAATKDKQDSKQQGDSKQQSVARRDQGDQNDQKSERELQEEAGLAPGPEQPVGEVELFAEDAGTVVGPLHVRDVEVDVPDDAAIEPDPASDMHPEVDKTRAQARAFDKDAEPEAISGEQVEYLQGVSGTYGLALTLNGTAYMLDKQTVGALKQVVDQAVAGLAL